MRDDTGELSPIGFTFEYMEHGWARATISDGVTNYCMDPSYVPSDPLFALIHAVVEVLRYGGEVSCNWHYEPAVDRWILRRAGDTLHIAIYGVRDGFFRPNGPIDQGGPHFSATCDLWKFAAKVRLAASRLQPAGEQYYDPSSVQRTPEYLALCTFLEEHKRNVRTPRANRRGSGSN